ncbi:hypothetical protein [Paenibacillus tyrfis]|uniref:hypothetical protein n=1 Tax=Paenibacillus tyrfis TaxID=1501230 RepID=UPI000B58FDE7|nr:hypothetical protein [Paenibacillus tyrfis]
MARHRRLIGGEIKKLTPVGRGARVLRKRFFTEIEIKNGGGVSTGEAIAFAFVCGKYPLLSGF